MRTSRPLILLIAAGVALRIFLLLKFPDLWFCSDEANLGIMALRLLHERKFSIFIAGESYGGFLGVALISFFTFLTESPFIGIKLVPILFFVLFATTLFVLGRSIFGTNVALLGTALVSFSPSFLTVMGVRERGPHPETLFLGTLLMLLTIRIRRQEQVRLLSWFGWGTLAGFSWYTNYLSVVFIVPCCIYLLVYRAIPLRWAALTSVATGSLSGSALYWLFALREFVLPPFGSQAPSDFLNPLAGLRNFVLVGFPIIAGARWSFHRDNLVPGLSHLVVGIYILAIACFFLYFLRRRIRWTAPSTLVALQLLFYPLIFAFSRYAWMIDEPRYLIGLYASLPLVLGWFLTQVWRRSRIAAAALLLLPTGLSTYGSLNTPSQVFNTIFNEPNGALIEFMRKKELTHFYGNYWIVYRVMFEGWGEFTGANHFSIRKERYPELKEAVDKHPHPAYIAWVHEVDEFKQFLDSTGRTYDHHQVGRYTIFYNIHPRPPVE